MHTRARVRRDGRGTDWNVVCAARCVGLGASRGGSAIMEAVGKDGTDLFEGQGHSKDAAHILARLVIGKLARPSSP